MSDMAHEVLIKLGAMGATLENLVQRSDEDRKDAGRHRENQRKQMSEVNEGLLSLGDRVTRIEPIAEYLHKQDMRKKLAREWTVRFGRGGLYIAATFTSLFAYAFGFFQKTGAFITSLFH